MKDTLATVRQRQAADPAYSAWVGASAGSGKTKVLTERILRLLLAGVQPYRILAITFTKAAAAEMATRLNKTLASWATIPPQELETELDKLYGDEKRGPEIRNLARQLFSRVIDESVGVRIETVHGFCQSVLKRFPIEANLSPQFEVLDDRTAREMLEASVNAILQLASNGAHAELEALFSHASSAFAESSFMDLVNEIVRERSRFEQLFAAYETPAAVTSALFAQFEMAPGTTRAVLELAACQETAFDGATLRQTVEAMQSSTTKTDEKNRPVMAYWLAAAPAERIARLDEYTQVFLTKEGEIRKSLLAAPLAKKYPVLAEAMFTEAARLKALVAKAKTAGLIVSTTGVLVLAKAILSEYDTRKRLAGQLDFEDMILRTRALLTADEGAAAWVLYKLDGGIDHILLDESQDTNPEQWDLLKTLVREFCNGNSAVERSRSVFVVGDEKQSIYSFQRADPAEYKCTRMQLAEWMTAADLPWQEVGLTTSFRSTAPILQAVDRVFADPAAYAGVSATPPQHLCDRQHQAGLVELWKLAVPMVAPETDPWEVHQRENAASPATLVAERIADTIAGWLARGERLEALNRPMQAGDILILVRERGTFVNLLVKILKQRGIKVSGADRMKLTGELAVQDLLSLMQVLLLPEDDLNLAIVLRSPLLGFSDDLLFDIAWQRPGTLWDALQNNPSPLATEGFAWLQNLRGQADFVPPYELLAGILSRPCPADSAGSGRRAMLARLGTEALDPLDELLNAALAFETQHSPSLESFLHWITARQTEIKRESTRTGADDGGQVAIMTVHGAKGLQAPVVFLADTGSVPQGRQSKILWQSKNSAGVQLPLWAPAKVLEEDTCQALRDRISQASDEEYRRLLYVAMTRAADRLYIAGWQGAKPLNERSWYRLIERGFQGWDKAVRTEDDGWICQELQTAPLPAAPAETMTRAGSPAIPACLLQPAPKEVQPVRPLTPSRLGEVATAVASPLDPTERNNRFERGRLTHRLLEALPAVPQADRLAIGRRFLAGQTMLAADIRDNILQEVLKIIEDPQFSAVFGPESQAEVPLSGLIEVNGETVQLVGQIDRLLVTKSAVTIIDFKTNRPPSAKVADIPLPYLRQLAAYRATLARIYPQHTLRAALLWTYGPTLMEVPPELLDSAFP